MNPNPQLSPYRPRYPFYPLPVLRIQNLPGKSESELHRFRSRWFPLKRFASSASHQDQRGGGEGGGDNEYEKQTVPPAVVRTRASQGLRTPALLHTSQPITASQATDIPNPLRIELHLLCAPAPCRLVTAPVRPSIAPERKPPYCTLLLATAQKSSPFRMPRAPCTPPTPLPPASTCRTNNLPLLRPLSFCFGHVRHLSPLVLPMAGLHVPIVRGGLVLHVGGAKVGVEHTPRDPLSLHVVVGEVVVALRRYLEYVAVVSNGWRPRGEGRGEGGGGT